MFERHAQTLANGIVTTDELNGANILLRRIERFWANSIDYSARSTEPINSAA
jgi:hypothetical protein